MIVLRARNVAQALPKGVDLLLTQGVREESRAGPVLVCPAPVCTVYDRPRERVLFSPVRDANPFLHLAESLWMLAGRPDSSLLNMIEPDLERRTAYGHRWRTAFGLDQLDAVVDILQGNPSSYHGVVQMWDATRGHEEMCYPDKSEDIPTWGCNDLDGGMVDCPRSTHAYLRVRQEIETVGASAAHGLGGAHQEQVPYLDLTVLCRANDVVRETYGSDAVCFSVLQEYLAARIGVRVGTMYQFSNNYHMYDRELQRLATNSLRLTGAGLDRDPLGKLADDRYERDGVEPLPLVDDPEAFDEEVELLMGVYERDGKANVRLDGMRNSFLSNTAWPALMAHRAHRQEDWRGERGWVNEIKAPDWRVACGEWLERRAT